VRTPLRFFRTCFDLNTTSTINDPQIDSYHFLLSESFVNGAALLARAVATARASSAAPFTNDSTEK